MASHEMDIPRDTAYAIMDEPLSTNEGPRVVEDVTPNRYGRYPPLERWPTPPPQLDSFDARIGSASPALEDEFERGTVTGKSWPCQSGSSTLGLILL
jgi:hypothetical protein